MDDAALAYQAENRVRAVLFGARWADFKVESTVPKGPVLISHDSRANHRHVLLLAMYLGGGAASPEAAPSTPLPRDVNRNSDVGEPAVE
jgi:hypothetical protein